MKVEILGVGTGLCPELGNVSFLVWDDNEMRAILFECGSTVYPKLRNMELLSGRKIIGKIVGIFISHGHSDHIGSLDMLLSYRRLILGQKTVLGGAGLDDYFQLCALDRTLFEEVSGENAFKLFQTEHYPNMESWGCLWNDDIFYSGDSGRSLLLTSGAKRAKLIIHEVSPDTIFYRKDDVVTDLQVHVGIEELYKNSTQEVRAKTWLTHYAPQEKEALLVMAEAYGFAGLLEPCQIINF